MVTWRVPATLGPADSDQTAWARSGDLAGVCIGGQVQVNIAQGCNATSDASQLDASILNGAPDIDLSQLGVLRVRRQHPLGLLLHQQLCAVGDRIMGPDKDKLLPCMPISQTSVRQTNSHHLNRQALQM